MDKLESYGTLYMIVYIVSASAGVLFSAFMMYMMWRTNRSVTRAVKNINSMSEQVTQGLPILLDTLNQKNRNLDSELLQAAEHIEEIPPGRFIHEQKK